MCCDGRPARWEINIGSHVLSIHFLPVPFWLATKMGVNSLTLRPSLTYLTASDLMREVMENCVVKVELDFREIDKESLPLGVVYFIVNAILTFNGLTPVGGEKLQRSLNFLKEYSLSQFQGKDWVGKPPPSYFSLISFSYFTLNKGLPFSKPTVMEEPYVLVQAWMAIADAEQTYYKLLEEETKSRQPHPPGGTPPIQPPKDMSQILHEKFSFPLPPIPTEK